MAHQYQPLDSRNSDGSSNPVSPIYDGYAHKEPGDRKTEKLLRFSLVALISAALGYSLSLAFPYSLGSHSIIPKHFTKDAVPVTRSTAQTSQYFFPNHGSNHETFLDKNISLSDTWFDLPAIMGDGMDQCLTYKERYIMYIDPLPKAVQIPARQSRTLFLIRAQPAHFLPRPPPDFVYHLRSIIYEVELVAGMDVVILVDVDEEEFKPDWIEAVPEEFRPRVASVTQHTLSNYFPNVVSSDGVNAFWNRSQIVNNWYMDTHREQYDFLWALEADARLAGGSWPQFFNNVNASIAGQKKFPETPHLIHFGNLGEWPKWHYRYEECKAAWGEMDRFYGISLHLHGYSRELNDKMTAVQRAGKSCWDEQFIASAAMQSNLSRAQVRMPIYRNGTEIDATTWTWRLSLGHTFYQEWKDTPKSCRYLTLLHSYKTSWDGREHQWE